MPGERGPRARRPAERLPDLRLRDDGDGGVRPGRPGEPRALVHREHLDGSHDHRGGAEKPDEEAEPPVAEERLEPVPQRLHVVRETGHQLAGSFFAEVVDIQVDHIAVKAVSQIEQGEIDHAADQRLLPELEDPADGHTQHH